MSTSIIFDLEDAVAPAEKPAARETLARALDAGDFGYRQRIVRINGTDTEWGEADARAVAGMECDALLLPKAENPGRSKRLQPSCPERLSGA